MLSPIFVVIGRFVLFDIKYFDLGVDYILLTSFFLCFQMCLLREKVILISSNKLKGE